jgi:hypothetical protein
VVAVGADHRRRDPGGGPGLVRGDGVGDRALAAAVGALCPWPARCPARQWCSLAALRLVALAWPSCSPACAIARRRIAFYLPRRARTLANFQPGTSLPAGARSSQASSHFSWLLVSAPAGFEPALMAPEEEGRMDYSRGCYYQCTRVLVVVVGGSSVPANAGEVRSIAMTISVTVPRRSASYRTPENAGELRARAVSNW